MNVTFGWNIVDGLRLSVPSDGPVISLFLDYIDTVPMYRIFLLLEMLIDTFGWDLLVLGYGCCYYSGWNLLVLEDAHRYLAGLRME